MEKDLRASYPAYAQQQPETAGEKISGRWAPDDLGGLTDSGW